MNRDRAKELLPIIEAFANGEEVEWRVLGIGEEWLVDDDFGDSDLDGLEYRVKPKARAFWVCWEHDGDDTTGYCVYPLATYQKESLVDHWNHYIKVREVL